MQVCVCPHDNSKNIQLINTRISGATNFSSNSIRTIGGKISKSLSGFAGQSKLNA